MKRIFTILMLSVATSAAGQKDSTVISKFDDRNFNPDKWPNHTRHAIAKVTRTMWGYKYLFVSDAGKDTTITTWYRFDRKECYLLRKPEN